MSHEESHGDQFEEAIKSNLTVKSGIIEKKGGKETELEFSGQIDKILDQASAKYDDIKSKNPKAVKKMTKDEYVKSIFNKAVNAINSKMSGDKETDANERAAKKIGGKDKMPYTFGGKQIKLSK
jgi:hypothetical protein